LDATHFAKLVDRWVQNLRRGAGFKVQYFAAIEPQHRLAPHVHVAMRGAIERRVIRAVTRGTYFQLWWRSFDVPLYAIGWCKKLIVRWLARSGWSPTWCSRHSWGM
jgi:hypothetical protein